MNDYQKVVDLSHRIHPRMKTFPVSWHKPVAFETLGTIETVGRNTSHVHIGTHSGTHIDAPSHFIPGGFSISELECGRFIGAATYVNLRETGEQQEVTGEFLSKTMNPQETGKILVLDFGWSKNYSKDSYYPNQPFLSQSACEFLLTLKPKMIAYDVAMPDNPANGYGMECDSPMHKMFLERNVPLLENLRIVDPLPPAFFLSALPLNLEKLDGSPTRCVALI